MTQEIDNYARFYALLKQLPGADKETLVWQFTGGRTTHLRQMAPDEYDRMCRRMELVAGYEERREAFRRETKKKRSTCLKLMQQMGIDTTDWARVNDFCMNPRIAGKPFARIKPEELDKLAAKLRSIRRKGGLKPTNKKDVKQPGRAALLYIGPETPEC